VFKDPVWKLDRLSWCLNDLLMILLKIDQAGAGSQSQTETIDTTVPAGRVMIHMLGSFAEFERTIIRERTRVGLEQARIRGHVPGRKPTLSPDQRTGIVEAVTSVRGTAADVARLFNVRRASFCALSFRNEQSLSVGFREHSAMTPACHQSSTHQRPWDMRAESRSRWARDP